MLPEYYYISPHGENYGDKAFLIETIDQLPISRQQPISNRYSEIYSELSNSDPQNCRFRCNTWLRKQVERHKPVDDGAVF